jgi:hypothetical protein
LVLDVTYAMLITVSDVPFIYRHTTRTIDINKRRVVYMVSVNMM